MEEPREGGDSSDCDRQADAGGVMTRAAFYSVFALLIAFWVWVIFRSVGTSDWMALLTVPLAFGFAFFMMRRLKKRG